MHFKVIGCHVLRRELYDCAARSPHVVDVVMLPQGLHDQPDTLRTRLQTEIDMPLVRPPRGYGETSSTGVEADRAYDAIILGYALCSNGTAGLTARTCPLVIPRAHDCISLLLGSGKRYQDYFAANPGTYWYSRGWIETCPMPGKARFEQTLAHYVAKYGEDNALYLMEMEADWYRNYHRAVYIREGFSGEESDRAFTRQCAADLKWEYDELPGDMSLIQRILDGDWREDEVLVLPPGKTSEADPTHACILRENCNA